ncbi:MAG: imidazole glycerol phosphate synthase subunit HisH [Candidatus Kapaibacterium sp.]|jgi:glutamine amidotransferase
MKVVIVKYNAGNTRSVHFALERLGISAEVSDSPELIRSADKVILPGVGQAASAMAYLKQNALNETIKHLTQPVLGICLGMQLLCKHSEEGDTECLGIFDQDVIKLDSSNTPGMKVPHVGWNTLDSLHGTLFDGISEGSFMYFVHSYYVGISEHTISRTDYTTTFSSAIHRNNFFGVQFHPEKSLRVGEQLLKNFLAL